MNSTNQIQVLAIEVSNSESTDGCADGYTVVHRPTLTQLLDAINTSEVVQKASALAPTQNALSAAMQHADDQERRIRDASLFMQELLDSVETLSGVADEHGSRTHADLFYLHSAILQRGFIDLIEDDNSKVMDIAKSLPSGSYWATFIQEVSL